MTYSTPGDSGEFGAPVVVGVLRAESWGVPPGCLPEPLLGMASLGSLAAAPAAALLPAPVLHGTSHLNTWLHTGSVRQHCQMRSILSPILQRH